MNVRERAEEIVDRMLPPEVAAGVKAGSKPGMFAPELVDIGWNNIFEGLWAREGLDPRSRSLLTLGMLMALRASDEMMVHFPAGVRNGLTIVELEESLYHAAGYLGVPMTAIARRAAHESLVRAGMITDRGLLDITARE